ncbi:MAG: hypothetical protein ACIAQU_12195 [Phycisphaerales bacterium JB064]
MDQTSMSEQGMEQSASEQAQRLASGGLTEDIRGVMADIERRLDRLRVAHADREREREELEQRSIEVEERAAQLEEAAKELGERQREHEEAVVAAEARFTELDSRETSAREAFAKAKERHDALRAELNQQRETLDGERSKLDEERQAFDAERQRIEELAQEAAQQVSDLEEDRAALEATARELDERQKDLDSQASTMAEKWKELEQHKHALDARAEQLKDQDRKLAELSRQAAEQREKLSGDSSDLEQQKRWLAEQTKQADLLRARVKQLEAELEAAHAQVAEATDAEEVESTVAHELDITRAKLRDAAEIIAGLREQLDVARSQRQAVASGEPVSDEHLDRRKRRLSYVRDALRQEQAKIAKASELLKQRSAALAQRGGVAATPAESVEPKEPSRIAGIARLGMGMAGVAVALAVLAGVSWMAAGELAKPIFAASVTVAHDARGREVIAQDLAGWQDFHESLMEDPRFYEFTAERMRQRGLLGLGDAVSVKSFVESSVSWVSGRDGELKLEVREQGAGRAERVAETLAIALVGQANAARERRPDGLPSIVSQEAKAEGRPLTNEQPLYAGGIMVGLSLLSVGLGGLLSRRIGRMREEAAAEGATAMDDMGEQHEGRISIG